MNIEQYLGAFLAKNQSITLQDIGTIYFSGQSTLDSHNESQQIEFSENSLRFEFNKKAQADESFIQYLIDQTGKIKPLVASDLESYSIICKQFLNIGKPLLLKDIGVLQKNQHGAYEFTQGTSVIETIDTTSKIAIDKASQNQEISFSSVSKRKMGGTQINNKKGLFIILVLLIAMIPFLIFQSKPHSNTPLTSNIDSIELAKQKAISDSVKKNTPQPFQFKVIIGTYKDSLQADSIRLKNLQKNIQSFVIKDSSNYLLAIGSYNTISDSTIVKDSLKKIYGNKIFLTQ